MGAVEAEGPDEVFEAIGSGHGVALLAAGNAALYTAPGWCAGRLPLSPAEQAVAWRVDTENDPAVAAFLAALAGLPAAPRASYCW